jgi:hypothetical protein
LAAGAVGVDGGESHDDGEDHFSGADCGEAGEVGGGGDGKGRKVGLGNCHILVMYADIVLSEKSAGSLLSFV